MYVSTVSYSLYVYYLSWSLLQLDTLSSEDILRLRLETETQSNVTNQRNQIGDVNDFYEMTKSIEMANVDSLEHAKDKLSSSFPILDESNLKVKDLPAKKVHEVSRMANLVADIAFQCSTKHVIDVGAGKGYLSTFLAAEYGLKVTAIDCVKNNLDQLTKRAKLKKKTAFLAPDCICKDYFLLY